MTDPGAPVTGTPPPRPWWVKIFIAVGVLVVVFVVLALLGVIPGGPGAHGPARHMPDNQAPAEQSMPGGK